jgi:integrase
MTLYATGARRSELTHLRISDIDSQRIWVTPSLMARSYRTLARFFSQYQLAEQYSLRPHPGELDFGNNQTSLVEMSQVVDA